MEFWEMIGKLIPRTFAKPLGTRSGRDFPELRNPGVPRVVKAGRELVEAFLREGAEFGGGQTPRHRLLRCRLLSALERHAEIVRATVRRGAVEVASGVQHRRREGILSVASRGEHVQQRFLPVRVAGKTKHSASIQDAAKGRGAVEVPCR